MLSESNVHAKITITAILKTAAGYIILYTIFIFGLNVFV